MTKSYPHRETLTKHKNETLNIETKTATRVLYAASLVDGSSFPFWYFFLIYWIIFSFFSGSSLYIYIYNLVSEKSKINYFQNIFRGRRFVYDFVCGGAHEWYRFQNEFLCNFPPPLKKWLYTDLAVPTRSGRTDSIRPCRPDPAVPTDPAVLTEQAVATDKLVRWARVHET